MPTLNFSISINATPDKLWQVLWSDVTYRKWTSVFHPGSYAVSDWKEGSKVQFLTPEGNGMFSIIKECRLHEYMAFKHLGMVKNFEEQVNNEEIKQWGDAMETYQIKSENGLAILTVNVDAIDNYLDYFNNSFPKALAIIKELAEQPVNITVEVDIEQPIEKVWTYWTTPAHIIKWNNASPDWHTPFATNDLQTGGKFLSRMEAKDGSFGFDFEGVYTEVVHHELIKYILADNRQVSIVFTGNDHSTKLVETFEAETENTLELQQGGWQAILDNFKNYVTSF
jgi:uncharacterized protein YndB with AHSA1/START domain